MRLVRQVLPGLFIALVSIVLTVGGISLAFAEGNLTMPMHTPSIVPSITPTRQTPSATPLIASSTAGIVTMTATITPTACPIPEGWMLYIVQTGDTLEALAGRYHTNVDVLRQGNCLESDELEPGSELHVPALPTRTPERCGAPDGWVLYTVQPGDTLYHISVIFSTTVKALQDANCLGDRTTIVAGQKLYVPPVTPLYPTETFPWYVPPTATWTEIFPPTWTLTFTPTETPSNTP